MKPPLRSLTPMLAVANGERTREFYCGVLGFELLNSMEFEGKMGWCALGAGRAVVGSPSGRAREVEVMFSVSGLECGADRDTRRGVILYFYPDDVAALHATYKAKGVNVSDLRVAFYQMKEFTVEDPDGYQLWFGQETNEAPTARE